MRPFHYISIVFLVILSILLWLYFDQRLSAWWILPLFLIYVTLLVLGAIYIRWNFYLRSFDKGRDKRWIALTFDDGPAAETAGILDILKSQSVPAAFFTIGKNAAVHPELVKRWHDEGHLTGNHSYRHGFNFDWQSPGKMVEEIQRTNRTIRNITGQAPRLFRPPYGVTNPNLARAVRRTGMYSVAWSLRSFDTTAKDPGQLLGRILKELQGGDIILMHDSMAITRVILTELIAGAREKGFTFVRVDKMLDLDAYA